MPKRDPPRRRAAPAVPTSWDALATWYNGWVGEAGSDHHRQIAIPAVLRLLDLRPDERVLDLGCGQGVLAPSVKNAGADYTGVDASPRLIEAARRHHGVQGRFVVGDVAHLDSLPQIRSEKFDAAVFLLSAQDIDPLGPALDATFAALTASGRVVLLLTHPAFRIPRQSGWGWDEKRKLLYRRIDRYLSPLPVPMKPLPGTDRKTTRSFHRPIQYYVNELGVRGLYIDHMEEIPGLRSGNAPTARAERLAREEIPLFLGLRARRAPDQIVPK